MKNKFFLGFICLLIILCSFNVCFASDEPILQNTPEDEILSDSNVTVLRVSPTDTSGFHAIMLGLIGDYNPIVKDYTYQTSQGYYNHTIDIQPDWSWIASCATFCIVFFCFMLFLGKLFSR